jgi:hypothetical protein
VPGVAAGMVSCMAGNQPREAPIWHQFCAVAT